MATATTHLPNVPNLGSTGISQAGTSAVTTAGSSPSVDSAFVKFDDQQATVFVNLRHIVRLEYHPATARAHLQLSDGHHYYLSDETAQRVMQQLSKS